MAVGLSLAFRSCQPVYETRAFWSRRGFPHVPVRGLRNDAYIDTRFQRVYSDEQKEAIAQAWADHGIRPARIISERAEAGELEIEGKKIPAFKLPVLTVREIGKKELRRRAGRGLGRAANVEHRDATEAFRRRLAGAIDHELDIVERAQRRKHDKKSDEPGIDVVRLQKLGRALREFAALPGRNDRPAVAPKPQGSNATDQSLAGKLRRSVRGEQPTHDVETPVQDTPLTDNQDSNSTLEQRTAERLAALKSNDRPEHNNNTPPTNTTTTHNDTDKRHADTQHHNETKSDEPGSSASERFGLLPPSRVTVAPR